MNQRNIIGIIYFLFWHLASFGQHSVARQWNDVLLEAIRNDFARPTVHARNLFHTSIVMYDAWAVLDSVATPFYLGKTLGDSPCEFNGFTTDREIFEAQQEAISYAAYRILSYRFRTSPGGLASQDRFDNLMDTLGYDFNNTSLDYASGDPAALGNYIAECMINFGLRDGANERFNYRNIYYNPTNEPLIIKRPGNPSIQDYNRWQPLTLDLFIDQGGNEFPINTPEFLSPEWGQVVPFALKESDLTIYNRDEFDYWVYHDPGPPPPLDLENPSGLSEEYKWGFALVSIWSSHLDPSDGILIDISPASIGNIPEYPNTIEGLQSFYSLLEGGDISEGHSINPYTSQPYTPQIVPRADYARVLAEFWADGPDSETPPGHWFTMFNDYVNDFPGFHRKFRGIGPSLSPLEWDVKTYLTLGGAMHDAAISAWGIKGWYDYIRPVSAIRAMADLGQSSNPDLPSYHPGGLPLVDGYIELVTESDTLAGDTLQNVGKIKLYSWRGPDYINFPETDLAGVGWILAEEWWPYQRPSFVTPPFAGYISGHSTFSRAAAEVLTAITGDPFFPGGLAEYNAKQNEFLVFEEGPSQDITLQWATYRDASDQTSLSRIWGGIHPPADDIPGRLIGATIGIDAVAFAEQYFEHDLDGDGVRHSLDCNDTLNTVYPGAPEIMDGLDNDCNGIVDDLVSNLSDEFSLVGVKVFPNPVNGQFYIKNTSEKLLHYEIRTIEGKVVLNGQLISNEHITSVKVSHLSAGMYLLKITDPSERQMNWRKLVIQR